MTKNKQSSKPYDDTFKSELVHCSQLVIPLVNEVFKTNYGLHEKINFSNTELYNLQGTTERDVDTTFTIGDSSPLYHLECESSKKDIVVRMFEYDTMIALQQPLFRNGKLRVKFPASAVLYLRSAASTPNRMEITVEVGKTEFTYSIPVMRLTDYTLDDIFAKKLYFLLPFHFFVYENDFEDYNNGKKDINFLLEQFKNWMEQLVAVDEKETSAEVKGNLCQYAMNVALDLTAGYDKLHKEVDEYMGGRVSQYSPMQELINKVVAAKDAELADKDAELADKDAELADKDAKHAAELAKVKAEKEAEHAKAKAEKEALLEEIARLKAAQA